MSLALHVLLFIAVFIGMEAFAWAMHRYVMHGWLWAWHRSHHEPRHGAFELNDLFGVVFALPAMLFIWLGTLAPGGSSWFLPVGLGITAYGFVYFIFHDGLVHRRYPLPFKGRGAFWTPRIQAHRIHHAVSSKHGCVSFGFLWVQPARALKAELAQKRAAASSSSGA